MNLTNKNKTWEIIEGHPVVQEIVGMAKNKGASLYLVGGAVRDWLLNSHLSDDLDFMVLSMSAENLARGIANRLGGYYVLLDPTFGIHRVVLKEAEVESISQDLTLDISDGLDNSLEIDLGRRDLTVNAMALDLLNGELIDPYNGQTDLEHKSIRMVSEVNLLDDPLRLLRVFRIAAQIQSKTIDSATMDVVNQYKVKVLESAPERIHYEFLKMLSTEPCFPYLQMMADSGLLETLIPELIPARSIPPSGYHHLGLFEHTLELVKQSEILIHELPDKAQNHIRSPFNTFSNRYGLLKLACLLHDIGKPETLGQREDGRLTFYGHDELSETMTESVCKRWRVSNEVTQFVKKLVRWHLYPCQFGQTSPRKSVLRFFRRMGTDTPDVVLLALADRFSARGPGLKAEELHKSHQDHLWLVEQFYAEAETLTLPRLINGRDVMEVLNLLPGPKIKEILESLREAQQLGEVHTSEQAKDWIKRNF